MLIKMMREFEITLWQRSVFVGTTRSSAWKHPGCQQKILS